MGATVKLFVPNQTNPYSPEAIFRLAHTNPVVHNLLTCWRRGDVTWEQALVAIVLELARINDELFSEGLERLRRSPEPFIAIPSKIQ